MTDAQLAELRRMSREAFGQTYRLEVMLAVAESEDGLVNLTDVARALGVSVSNVQAPLRNLLALDLIAEAPSGDTKRKHYLRNPSAAWDWAREMRNHAAVRVAAAPTRDQSDIVQH